MATQTATPKAHTNGHDRGPSAQGENNYDVIVVGGGPGGYVAGIRAAQLGYKTLVIDREYLGGVCLNWGCIPSKALLKNAEIFNLFKKREEWGISADNLRFDFGKVVKRSQGVVVRTVKGIEFLFKKYGVHYQKAAGTFESANTLVLTPADGSAGRKVTGKHIIVATGARPRSLPSVPVDGKHILTAKEAIALPEQPKSMVIVGAGAIGVEFGYYLSSFGTKITLVELTDHVLPFEDAEVTEHLHKSLTKGGVEILVKSKVRSATPTASGTVKVEIETPSGVKTLEVDKVLSAVGVVPNTDGMGLETIGVELDHGYIKTEKPTYKTNVPGVYAIGDVIGAPLLAHVASSEGICCVETIAGLNPVPVNYDNVPSCTYAQPQVASVGLTEEKATAAGYTLKIGRFPFSASGKARAIGETEGMVKLIFDEQYGELLGAHIVGAEATEMLMELGMARSLEATYEEILKTMHPHPTLSEAIMEATGQAYGEAIHI